jgi:hypothetical protein
MSGVSDRLSAGLATATATTKTRQTTAAIRSVAAQIMAI